MTSGLKHSDAFVGYPRDYVLGIFEDHETADSAVAELIAAGFTEPELLVFSHPADARQLDRDGTEHGVVTTAERTVQELGDKDTLDEYAKALEAGGVVLGAHAADEGQREQASDLMKRAGGESIRYFGRFVVEDMDTAPNQPRP